MNTISEMLKGLYLDYLNLDIQPDARQREHRTMMRLTRLAERAERGDDTAYDALARDPALPLFAKHYTDTRDAMEREARAMIAEAQALTSTLKEQRCV